MMKYHWNVKSDLCFHFRTFCASRINDITLYNIYLPKLNVLDLRNNFLISLPPSLSYHSTLEVLLLVGNLITSPPPIIQTLPNLLSHDLKLTKVTTDPQKGAWHSISKVSILFSILVRASVHAALRHCRQNVCTINPISYI